MNLQKERNKIARILEDEKFMYRGVEWKADLVATYSDPRNKQLTGAPLMMMSGTGTNGERIRVWSHDVEACPVFDQVVMAPVGTPPVYDDVAIVEKPKKTKKETAGKGKKKQ